MAAQVGVDLMSFDQLPEPISGMEGPFRFRSGRIVYWDNRAGLYYDRSTDIYLSDSEADELQQASAPVGWGWVTT